MRRSSKPRGSAATGRDRRDGESVFCLTARAPGRGLPSGRARTLAQVRSGRTIAGSLKIIEAFESQRASTERRAILRNLFLRESGFRLQQSRLGGKSRRRVGEGLPCPPKHRSNRGQGCRQARSTAPPRMLELPARTARPLTIAPDGGTFGLFGREGQTMQFIAAIHAALRNSGICEPSESCHRVEARRRSSSRFASGRSRSSA